MIPYYKILVNGADMTESYDARLISLTVTNQSDSNSDNIELTVANPGWKIDPPKKSDQITISIGVDKNARFYHVYTVDTVILEGCPNKFTIKGLGCSFVDVDRTNLKAMQASKDISFDGLSIANIVRMIANEVGVKTVIDASFEKIVEHFDLNGQSYNAFLKNLASEYGGMYKIATKSKSTSDTNCFLVFVRASSGNTTSTKASDITTIDCNAIPVKPGWKADLMARTEFTGVRCFYHDTNSSNTNEVLAGTDQKVYAIKSPARNKIHAENWAKSLLNDFHSGSKTITFETPAHLGIAPEQFVQLKNFHPSLNTKWLVKCITYKLTKNEGLVTAYQLEIPNP